MFSKLTKVLGAMTTVSGAATGVSAYKDYKNYRIGKITDEDIMEVEGIDEIQDVGSETADEVMNEV